MSIHPEDLEAGQQVARLDGVTLPDGTTATVHITDGALTDGRQDGAPTGRVSAGTDADGTEWLLLPPAADLHAHIDKAYTWSLAGEPEGSLEDAVACWREFGATLSEEQIAAHARRQLDAALRAGVTTIRTHVNYHEGADPLRGIRAVLAAREDYRGLVDVQVVAMHGQIHDDGLVRDALALGVDLVGAAPHLSDDPRGEIDRAAAFAEAAGIGIDLHTDETLNPDSLDLIDLAERTRHWPRAMTRSAGHCVSLAVQPPDRLAAALDAAAEAGVSIIVNPLTNLYLQGWQHPVSMPRAIPPLRAILDAGVALAAGGDNVQDPFNPLGNGDMVDVAASLVIAGHLTPRTAWDVVTAGRSLAGLPRATGAVGDPADFVLVRSASVAAALAERAPDRVVVRAGRVVATRRTHTTTVPVPAHAAPPERPGIPERQRKAVQA
ncbi:amidohydrolase family protein [Microbacterium sp. cx-55]|uniref:amidohydrolase family protein n=1 Tax=Microbacterium sp. cx-55 TaxID=2875948 RepID=UPI001CBB196F|nr:amidohydrolase family protein [Microbacterium sp. cx-55]MBZ4487000.1 amidohydrolase family protein [Microbacterium sp. cx-55]UGB35919.1 amidohydrolase family protein [Microbacterium sp. cx-55]